jgi:hypothetical protein
MWDLEPGILLAFGLAQIVLLLIFLAGLAKISRAIIPLIDQFTSSSGKLKLPTVKEAMGFGLMKLIEGVDMSKVLGGIGKGPK